MSCGARRSRRSASALQTALPGSPWHEVIGVVQDVRDNGVQQPAPAIVYWPALATTGIARRHPQVARSVTFAIRTPRAGSEGLLNEIKQAVWAVNASLPLGSVRTMQEAYDHSMARTSFTLVMLSIAASAALVLGLVGIYGVIAYTVSQRTREIGIRLALGAQQGDVKRMFVRSGLALVAAGIVAGLSAAALLTQAMASVLFGVDPLDPVTFAVRAARAAHGRPRRQLRARAPRRHDLAGRGAEGRVGGTAAGGPPSFRSRSRDTGESRAGPCPVACA